MGVRLPVNEETAYSPLREAPDAKDSLPSASAEDGAEGHPVDVPTVPPHPSLGLTAVCVLVWYVASIGKKRLQRRTWREAVGLLVESEGDSIHGAWRGMLPSLGGRRASHCTRPYRVVCRE